MLAGGALAIAALIPNGPSPVRPAAAGATNAAIARKHGGGVREPKIDFDPITYDHHRKRQMAKYSKRHYGDRTWRLKPRAIVLHYTVTSTYPPVHNTFESNAPNLGETPGVCAQFVVDKDGTIYQQTRLYVRCRHTVGLNHVALGVEMVQEELGGRNESTGAILDRKRQINSATRLVAWLKQRYRIPMKDIIGHAMANDSHLFEDLEGWRNDHSDWRKGDVRTFRKRVNKLIRAHLSRGGVAERAAPAEAAKGEGARRRIVFGHSVEGRKLIAREIGDGDAKRTVLVVGEIHGDEPAGRSVVHRLGARPGRLRDVDAWTVVSANPDGHAAERRTNDDGVDLNRNFSAGWEGSEPPGSGYYAGPHPFSEPESKGLRDLVRRIDPDLTIYYHQPWGAVLAPCHGHIPAQRRYAEISGVPLDRCRGQKLPGTAIRWQNEHGGTAFVVEFAGGRLSSSEVRRNARAAATVGAG
jgi:hypothetical protein